MQQQQQYNQQPQYKQMCQTVARAVAVASGRNGWQELARVCIDCYLFSKLPPKLQKPRCRKDDGGSQGNGIPALKCIENYCKNI